MPFEINTDENKVITTPEMISLICELEHSDLEICCYRENDNNKFELMAKIWKRGEYVEGLESELFGFRDEKLLERLKSRCISLKSGKLKHDEEEVFRLRSLLDNIEIEDSDSHSLAYYVSLISCLVDSNITWNFPDRDDFKEWEKHAIQVNEEKPILSKAHDINEISQEELLKYLSSYSYTPNTEVIGNYMKNSEDTQFCKQHKVSIKINEHEFIRFTCSDVELKTAIRYFVSDTSTDI